jgi:hypothetical protein
MTFNVNFCYKFALYNLSNSEVLSVYICSSLSSLLWHQLGSVHGGFLNPYLPRRLGGGIYIVDKDAYDYQGGFEIVNISNELS